MKDLAKKLKIKLDRATTLYRSHPESMPFDHQKDVIIPFSIARDIAENMGKGVSYSEYDRIPHEQGRSPFRQGSDRSHTPVVDEETTDPVRRPAIVSVMGHVDHGKTTLLDLLRGIAKHNRGPVAPYETGLITQRVTAFNLQCLPPSDSKFTFLDTPGHAAFTRMRDSGCIAADMVLLVIAADEGIQNQTIESMEIAKEWKLPIIVALNKIDLLSDSSRLDVLIEETERQLRRMSDRFKEIVPISATQRLNVDRLLQAIDANARMLPLQTDLSCLAEGFVVEANPTSKGKAINVILRRGTLRANDYYVVGDTYAKCKEIRDHGLQLDQLQAGDYGEILGYKGRLPATGESFLAVSSRDEGIKVTDHRKLKLSYQELLAESAGDALMDESDNSSEPNGFVDENQPQLHEDDVYVALKADQRGTLEAFLDAIDAMNESALENSNNNERHPLIHVIHKGVGRIDVTDVRTSIEYGVPLLAFNTSEDPTVKRLLSGGKAKEQLSKKNKIKSLDKLQVLHFNIYQDLLDTVEAMLSDAHAPSPEDRAHSKEGSDDC